MCLNGKIKQAFVVLCLAGVSMLQAQMVGTPVGSKGQGSWSLACTGSFMNQQVGNETAISQRWLVKSTYGVVPWMDFVATLGAANLELDTPHNNVQDFEGKPRFAFGAGLTFTVKRETELQPVGIFGGAHFLRFPAEGSFQQIVSGQDVIYLRREYQMEHDWREYLLFGGVSYRLKRLRFYGCGVGWGVSRLEKKMEYHLNDITNEWDFIDEESGEYQSELWTGALAGIEFSFPKTGYMISLEGLFYNTENFILTVGIGQTGIGESGW